MLPLHHRTTGRGFNPKDVTDLQDAPAIQAVGTTSLDVLTEVTTDTLNLTSAGGRAPI